MEQSKKKKKIFQHLKRLPNDKKLNELSPTLKKKDPIILEYGSELNQDIIIQFMKLEKGEQEESCIIN